MIVPDASDFFAIVPDLSYGFTIVPYMSYGFTIVIMASRGRLMKTSRLIVVSVIGYDKLVKFRGRDKK